MAEEEQAQEEEKKEEDDSSSKSPVEEAKETIENLKKENERMEINIAKMEADKIETMLSGKAEAGIVPPKKEKLSDEDYSEALLRGEVNPLAEDGII